MSFAMSVPAKSVEITENFSPALRALTQPAVGLYSMLNDEFGCWIIMPVTRQGLAYFPWKVHQEREYINCEMIG
jgi:hypothetical protein